MPLDKIRIEWKIKQDGKIAMFVEQLRYAGIVSDVKHTYQDDEDAHGILSFTLHAPEGVHPEIWASMNTKRMRSFLIRAKEID